MPKIPINYTNTIIYKFVCDDVNIKDVYVGATTDMIRRKSTHKRRCNKIDDKEYNKKIYVSIRENGGWENWTMLEVEKYPCNNLMESSVRERYWLEFFNANMNKVLPSRTDKEYRNDNKEKIHEQKQQYYETNKETILNKQAEYYQTNKEHRAEYYQTNKEKISEYKKTKCICCCGNVYSLTNKSQHNKSKTHLSNIQNNINTLDV